MAVTKRKWTRPLIEVVTLEAEQDVLATCYTTSMTSKEHLASGCRQSKCSVYP